MTEKLNAKKWKIAGWINFSKSQKAVTFRIGTTYYAILTDALVNYLNGKYTSCYFTEIPPKTETQETSKTSETAIPEPVTIKKVLVKS